MSKFWAKFYIGNERVNVSEKSLDNTKNYNDG